MKQVRVRFWFGGLPADQLHKALLSNWKHLVGAQIFPSRITSANWKQLNEQNAVTVEDSGKCSVAIIVPNSSYPSVYAY